MVCIQEGFIVWIPLNLHTKILPKQKWYSSQMGTFQGHSPPLFVVGYQFGRCRILQKFQYLHKFFFDGHCRCPFQVPNQILDHLKIQRKLTEHLLSACSALATVLCALVFSRMCKCNDRLFFTFCTDLPNANLNPLACLYMQA